MTLTDNDLELMFGGVFERDGLPEPGQQDRLISANVIRALLLGLPFGDPQIDGQPRQAISRLIIKGALVVAGSDDEPLKLVDAGTGQGDQPPALIFENCRFERPIDMSHARVGRLSLKGSRLIALKAHGATFAGTVDLSDVASSEVIVPDPASPGRKPKCEIDMGGAKIDGHLRAKDSAFTVRYRASGQRRAPGDPVPYALNLADCQIEGEVHVDRATIDGGLSLGRSKVRGGLWMTGGTVVAEWADDSIDLEQAHLGGSLVLRAASDRAPMIPFRSAGTVSLYATTIDGEVYCSGAAFELRQRSEDWPVTQNCIHVYQAKIAKQLRFQEATDDRLHISEGERAATTWFNYEGTISIQNSSTGGLSIRGTPIGVEKENGIAPAQRSIDISQSSFAGDVWIGAAKNKSGDAADQRHLTGNIQANWCEFERDFSICGLKCSEFAFYDSKANGELIVDELGATKIVGGRFSASRMSLQKVDSGDLHLDSVRVRNDLSVTTSKFAALNLVDSRVANNAFLRGVEARSLVMSGAHIEGNFNISDFTCAEISATPLRVCGKLAMLRVGRLATLDLSDSEIDKGLTLESIDQIANPGRFALTGAKVGANCDLKNITSRASINCDRLRVAGNMTIDDIKIMASTWDWMQLSLDNAKVQGTLQLSDIGFTPFVSNAGQARCVALPFYPSWNLVEVHQDAMGDTALLMKRPNRLAKFRSMGRDSDSSGDVVLLDCTSLPIHRMNTEHLRLNDSTVLDYLKFFCAYVWGEHGAFRLITERWEFDRLNAAGSESKPCADLDDRLKLKIIDRKPDHYKINAIVSYSDALFASDFKINTSGLVEMLEDDPVAININADRLFRYSVPYRSDPRDSTVKIEFVSFSSSWSNDQQLLQKYRPDDVFAIDLTNGHAGTLVNDHLKKHVNIKLSVFGFDRLDYERTSQDLTADQKEIEREQKAAARKQADRPRDLADEAKKEFGAGSVPLKEESSPQSMSAKQRLDWLKRNKIKDETVLPPRYVTAGNTNQFDAYPYERVAECYRKSGRSDDALAILRAKSAIVSDHWQRDWRRYWRDYLFGRRSTRAQILAVLASAGALIAYSLAAPQGSSANDAVFALDAFGSPSALTAAGSAAALLVIIAIALYWGPWIVRKLFDICFGYGLGMGRALATAVACVLAGWIAVEVANRGALRTPEITVLGVPEVKLWDFASMPQALVLSQTPVLTMVRTPDNSFEARAVAAGTDAPGDEIACGNQVNGFIYALDVFLPLVDLQQENQCQPTQQAWAVGWRWGKAAYALLGWVVISLSIVMMTGFLRRQSVE